jgi:hypothetical protein
MHSAKTYLQTLQVPPPLAQCPQELQFVHALQVPVGEHVPVIVSPQQELFADARSCKRKAPALKLTTKIKINIIAFFIVTYCKNYLPLN